MTNSNISTGTGIALIALVLLALAITPVSVRAADLPMGGYEYGYDIYDYSSPSYDSGYEYGYDIYDYSYPSYDYGYDTGSYYTPGSYYLPGGASYSSSAASAVSSVYAPTNTCTAPNSCNDNSVFNAPTVVTVTDYESDNDDRDYDKKKKKKKDYDYEHVSYRAPYVTLAQVPYTGLELGPVGQALYWSFLVLWCLVAAYLIAIKRVQVSLFNSLNRFLFGDVAAAPAARSYRKSTAVATPAAPAPKGDDVTDEFVISQINRSRN